MKSEIPIKNISQKVNLNISDSSSDDLFIKQIKQKGNKNPLANNSPLKTTTPTRNIDVLDLSSSDDDFGMTEQLQKLRQVVNQNKASAQKIYENNNAKDKTDNHATPTQKPAPIQPFGSSSSDSDFYLNRPFNQNRISPKPKATTKLNTEIAISSSSDDLLPVKTASKATPTKTQPPTILSSSSSDIKLSNQVPKKEIDLSSSSDLNNKKRTTSFYLRSGSDYQKQILLFWCDVLAKPFF